MADPQPTDAHLRIAHSISEAIMMRDFSKHQRKILDLILRLSWGCGKKYAHIPRQRDFKVVGIFEGDVKKELDWLEVSQIINRSGPFYWFEKDYDKWQISRVRPYDPKQLSDLLSLNLNKDRPELSDLLSSHPKLGELLSENFVEYEERTSGNTKFSTSESASPKETLNKEYSSNTDIGINNPVNTEKAQKIWKEALELLETRISKANYKTWLQDTVGYSLEDKLLTVKTKNEFVSEYLIINQKSLVENAIMTITKEPMIIKYTVGGDK